MSTPLDHGFLSATYRQYKKDTAYIAGWLVEASKKIGFSLSSIQASAPSESQRLKGKDRKKAKEAAKKQPSEYHIRTVDFVPIAEAIAKQVKKVKVPSPLLTVFGRAIKARKEAQAYYGSNQLADEGHHHFINILSRVQEILRPLAPVAKVTKPEKSDGVHNRFTNLPVEEAADTLSTENVKPEPKLPPVVAAEIEQSDEDVEEEFFFAIHLFLKGIHEIQEVVQDSWFKSTDFTRDYILSGLLSNTAIDLVRRAEGELDLLLKRPSKYPASKFPVWCLPALLYHHYRPLPDGVSIQNLVVPSDVTVKANKDDYDKLHANWCFWPVYTGLRFCVNRVKKFPYLDANEEELQAIGADSVTDIMRTFKLAKEFRSYTSNQNRFWAQDEVTRGMKLMFTDKVIPIWVTFGIQTLLDIQDIMDYRMGEGEGNNVPFNNIRVCHRDEMELWWKFYDWKAPFKTFYGPGTPCGLQREVCNDTLQVYHQLVEHADIPAVKYNPIRCGLIKYDFYLQLHDCGFYTEKLSGLVCVLGHIYTAGKLLYPDDPAWPDMEYVLYSQDPNHVFYGGKPKSLDEAYRKLNLAYGNKLPRANGRGKSEAKNTNRMFQKTSILSPVLEDRMTGWSDHTNESVDELAGNLNALLCDKAEQGKLARQLGASPDWVESEIDTRRIVRLFEDVPAEGSPVLLRDLSLFIEGEMQNVYFDWISMYMICGDIWKDVLSALAGDPILEPLMYDPHPGIGLHVLKLAAEYEDRRGKIDLDDPEFAPQLRKVWACIQEAIRKPSKHEYNEPHKGRRVWVGDECLAQQFSRNHLTVAWQLIASNTCQLFGFYENWESEDMHKSAVLSKIHHHHSLNDVYRDREMDLLLVGLRAECLKEKTHIEKRCGRCRRRNFFLEHYGSVSSLRGTEIVDKHLGQKYHGKDAKKVEEDAPLKALARSMFGSSDIPFVDGDNEAGSDSDSDFDKGEVIAEKGYAKIRSTADGKYQVEMPIRAMFSKPGIWECLASY